MGNETGGGDDDHARQQPTDEEPPVDEPKEPGVELKATPAGSNAKGKGSKCSDKQAKALKALQINGTFAFNKGSTTTAPYDFRGGSSYGGGSASSNPASTNKPSKQPVSKNPNKPAPKSQKKPAVKKAQPKAKKPATPKPKAVPKPAVIDLEEEDEDGVEETEKQSNGRVSRSSKTASIQPTSSTASSKILEEINQATEAARQELLVLRREKESVERAHKDFKRAQLKADKDEQEKRQKSKKQRS